MIEEKISDKELKDMLNMGFSIPEIAKIKGMCFTSLYTRAKRKKMNWKRNDKEWVKVNPVQYSKGNISCTTKLIPICGRHLEEAGIDPRKCLLAKRVPVKNGKEIRLVIKEI